MIGTIILAAMGAFCVLMVLICAVMRDTVWAALYGFAAVAAVHTHYEMETRTRLAEIERNLGALIEVHDGHVAISGQMIGIIESIVKEAR